MMKRPSENSDGLSHIGKIKHCKDEVYLQQTWLNLKGRLKISFQTASNFLPIRFTLP